MGYLILAILCSVGIAHLFKQTERKRIPGFALLTVNYAIASIIALSSFEEFRLLLHNQQGMIYSLIIGFLFVLSFFLLMQTIGKSGIAVPVSLMRLSAVLPTIGSIILFQESPRMMQWIGITVAFIALPLAGDYTNVDFKKRKTWSNGFLLGILLFFIVGTADFLFKVITELNQNLHASTILSVVFPTSFIVASFFTIVNRQSINPPVIGYGILLGLLNYFSTFFFIKALQILPGMMVYPINGIGIILISTLTGWIFWQERLKWYNSVFIGLACLSILLIYQV